MSSYLGRHAEWYDLFYADKPYEREAAFVAQCLREHSQGSARRVLELACGTGRHAVALGKLNYEVLATDYSRDMLAQAAARVVDDIPVKFEWADMRELPRNAKAFDAAVCLFDSIGYVQSNEAIVQVLKGISAALDAGGLFVFEFWHAPAMWRSFDPLRVRSWTTADGELIRISTTTLHPETQTATVRYRILELRSDGQYESLEESQTNRFFQVQEMRALLEAGGFDAIRFHAGFDHEAPIREDTWHIVAVARKRPVAADFAVNNGTSAELET